MPGIGKTAAKLLKKIVPVDDLSAQPVSLSALQKDAGSKGFQLIASQAAKAHI